MKCYEDLVHCAYLPASKPVRCEILVQLHDYVGRKLIETWKNGTWLCHNNICPHTAHTIVEFQVKQIFCITTL